MNGVRIVAAVITFPPLFREPGLFTSANDFCLRDNLAIYLSQYIAVCLPGDSADPKSADGELLSTA